jgi:hypothetical protein
VLYLRLQKALYGMMKSALLFYRKLVSELREMGFTIPIRSMCCKQDSIWDANDD